MRFLLSVGYFFCYGGEKRENVKFSAARRGQNDSSGGEKHENAKISAAKRQGIFLMAENIEIMRFSPPYFLKNPSPGADFGGSNADFSKISAVTLGFYHFSGGDIFNIAEISAASKNRGVIPAEKNKKMSKSPPHEKTRRYLRRRKTRFCKMSCHASILSGKRKFHCCVRNK